VFNEKDTRQWAELPYGRSISSARVSFFGESDKKKTCLECFGSAGLGSAFSSRSRLRIAAKHHFVDRVDTDKCGSPPLSAVITGTGYGYLRDDGVAVIPIAALKT
jgi:hypothetical protein